MKKTVLACVLALCLLAGCAAYARPVSIIPLIPMPEATAAPSASPTPEASAAPSPSVAPSPETTAEVSEAPSAAPSSADAALSARLDQVLAGFEGISGSVLIEKEGQILLTRGYGMADAEKGIANTPDTKFLVGSVTKQFTSMAVMQLYAKGLLDIHDKLSKYFPDFTRGDDIALTNLLQQTSGIPDFLNDDPKLLSAVPTADLTEEYVIGLMETKPLKFEPGSKYSYSNTNYLLLGAIVEKAGGMAYGDYLSQNIFEPLGMKNTGVFDVLHPPENMATGYRKTGTPIPFTDESGNVIAENANATAGCFGAGCLYSTVGDLRLWDQALSAGTLLPEKYADMMLAPSVHIENPDQDWAYGFGWVIENDPDVGTVYRHTGALGGFRAYNGIFAEHGITVIMLNNMLEFPDRDDIIPAVKKALAAAGEDHGNQGQEISS